MGPMIVPIPPTTAIIRTMAPSVSWAMDGVACCMMWVYMAPATPVIAPDNVILDAYGYSTGITKSVAQPFVKFFSPTHPITKDLKPFETTDELYTCLAGDRPVDVLATAKSKVDGKDYPMAFAFAYGAGRVFHSPLGHDAAALANPPVAELFRRGCAWAAGVPPVK